MDESCWFCKKNISSYESNLVKPFYKITHRRVINSRKVTSTSTSTLSEVEYQKDQVTIPRCASCAKLHQTEPKKINRKKNTWQVITALGIALISFIILSSLVNKTESINLVYVSLCCLFPFFSLSVFLIVPYFISANYWVSIGSQEEEHWGMYPKIKEMKKSGWVEGEKPPEQTTIRM